MADKRPKHRSKPARTQSKRPELVEADVLAEFLRVSPDTVLEWARSGRIPCRRFGPRTVRFDLDEVLESEERRSRREGGAA
jgi:excisionase family DNA binding protein